MRACTVAAVQIAPLPGPLTTAGVAANCAKGADWLRRCVDATGAELVVLPETASTGFVTGTGPEELWDLVSAFGRLMRETLALQPQEIIVDQTPVHVYMESILKRLEHEPRLAFSAVFIPPYQRARLVGLFLAVLELIKSRLAAVDQPEPFGEIWLQAAGEKAGA